VEYCIFLACLCLLTIYFFVSPFYEKVKIRVLGDINKKNCVAYIEEGKLCPIIDLTKVIQGGEKLWVRLYLNDFYIFFHEKDKMFIRTYHGLQLVQASDIIDVEVY